MAYKRTKDLSPLELADLQLKATRRLLATKEAEDSLIEFVKLMMPDPQDPDDSMLSRYLVAKHHQVLAAALEAVEKGDLPRLIITLPPRHGKSQIASKAFPAWFMGRDPYRQLIVASYSATMAEDFGREVRTYMQTPAYQQIFPNCQLRKGGAASDRIQTEAGGVGAFVGAGGALTGRGADCLVGDTIILTESGEYTIKQLCEMTYPPRVMSVNTVTHEIEYRCIQASIVRRSAETFKITTASGRVVQATGNHPFISAGRFIKGSEIAPGDSLLRLVQKEKRNQSCKTSGERDEGSRAELLLQQKLLLEASERDQSAYGENDNLSAGHEVLPKLQHGVFCRLAWKKFREARGLLQQILRGSRSFEKNVGQRESEMETRSDTVERAAAFSKGFPADAGSCPAKGQRSMCDLRKGERLGEAGGSSYRQLAHEQRRLESCDIVQPASSYYSCGLGVETTEDIVSGVERVCADTYVYDIQVEGNHSFFANGIGCLNCLLIDDPVKDREDANSPTMREKLWGWFLDVAMTRLMGGMGRVVIIMTRWHEDDLVGRLTDPGNKHYNAEEAKQWKIIAFPALAEADDIMGREKDEPLWPERITYEFLNSQRRLNPRGFAALYQGKPRPDEGNFFKKDWLVTYQPHELPRRLRMYCASDHAVSTKQTDDPTCLIPCGVDEDDTIWILPDVWWRHAETDSVVEAMIEMMARHKPLVWWAERGHISKAIGPFLRKRMAERHTYCAIDEVVPVQDKQTRAQSIQGRMAMGKVRFPAFAPWWEKAVSEILTFPGGKHDDFVDALAYIGLGLGRMVSANRPAAAPVNTAPIGSIDWVKAASKLNARQTATRKALAGF